MKRVTGPVETKTAAATIVPLIAGVVFACAHAYGWFTPPPAYVQAGLITVLVGVVGWVVPHTSRTPAQPVIHVGGDPSKQPAIIKFDGTAAEADVEHLKAALKGIGFGPAAGPPPLTDAEVEAIKNRLNAPLTPPAAAPQPEGKP